MAHLMLEMLWLWHGVGIANFLLRTRWVNFVPRGLPPVRNTFTLWWSHIGNAIIYIFLLCFTLSVPLPCRAVEYSIYGCVASSFSRENYTFLIIFCCTFNPLTCMQNIHNWRMLLNTPKIWYFLISLYSIHLLNARQNYILFWNTVRCKGNSFVRVSKCIGNQKRCTNDQLKCAFWVKMFIQF